MFGFLWESWKTEHKPTEAELMHQKADASLIAEINSGIEETAKDGGYQYTICLFCKETTLDEYYRNKGYKVKTWTNGEKDIVIEISW